MSSELRVNRLPPASHERIKALHNGVVHYESQACSRCEETGFHVMLDIETLGLRPGAPVLTIGAALFCPHTGGVVDTLYLAMNPADTLGYADYVDPEVDKWWQNQPEAARSAAFSGTMHPEEALVRLFEFIPDDAKVWGNGATFDISILEHWQRAVIGEGGIPWKFWNIRDVRTAKAMFPDVAEKSLFNTGDMVAHHALDDALFQVRYTSAAVIASDAVAQMTELLHRTAQEPLLQEFARDEAVMSAHLETRRAQYRADWHTQENARLQAQVEELKALVEQARKDYLEQNSDGIHDCVTPYDYYR